MNHRLLLVAAGLATAAALHAQQTTSPWGYATTEGNAERTASLAYHGARWTTSYAHVDDTLRGRGARAISRLSLRRDGVLNSSTTYAGRQATIGVRMAHATWANVINSEIQTDATYRSGWWVNTLSPQNVSLPPLTSKPAVAPAAFAIHLPFDVPFYYNGNQALTLQLRSSTNNLGRDADYPLDALESITYMQGSATDLGTGCIATGRTAPAHHASILRNFGDPGIGQWQLTVYNGPASAPTVVMIGTAGADLPFGGCANLRVVPEVVFAGVATSASGYCNTNFTFRQHPSFIGAHLFSQIAIADPWQPGVPVALTNGVEAVYPRGPIFSIAVASGTSQVDAAVWPGAHRITKGMSLVVGID